MGETLLTSVLAGSSLTIDGTKSIGSCSSEPLSIFVKISPEFWVLCFDHRLGVATAQICRLCIQEISIQVVSFLAKTVAGENRLHLNLKQVTQISHSHVALRK
jgi:hypothetical protein